MSQSHFIQNGIFHVTTNVQGKIPWCTWNSVPEILIDNLQMTRNVHRAELYAFCILPNHMHILLKPGEKGLSAFMQSFKSQSMLDMKRIHSPAAESRGFPLRDIKWQKSFYDERIRDEKQLRHALAYVRFNAYRHDLSIDPNAWKWSSIKFPHVLDPMEIWM